MQIKVENLIHNKGSTSNKYRKDKLLKTGQLSERNVKLNSLFNSVPIKKKKIRSNKSLNKEKGKP